MSLSITFQDPEHDEILELGEFSYAQLTYDLLRGCKDLDGDIEDDIAYYNSVEEAWYFIEKYSIKHGYRKGPWSDIIFG